ncbi:hypothetical protein L249_1941 [Ophiocordyceps polyrhachis-furcata BCC 54312]|uniref:Uncharacterized protein n=1 Tax=Ophiocordyceps polyrhachis-furcata BCC 54312 TaxID=1330021 RepID=A0A367LQZ8_9HYPO|nr:hypothetical protein L249_1941 [Ophiocordyceps polyrhachis-furcata BCC 54312]
MLYFKRLFSAVEIIISNQGVDYVIEKKKTNHVIVVLYSAPIAVTIAVTRRCGGP